MLRDFSAEATASIRKEGRKEGRKEVDRGAEDVVHDVLMDLWKRRATLVIRGRVSTYLFTAVRNRCRTRIEAESRRVPWDRARPAEIRRQTRVPASADDGVYRRELLDRLHEALGPLTPERREAFDALARGLDRREVARALGISVAAVDQRLARGRADLASLRAWLERQLQETG